MLRAIIFDMDGVLVNSQPIHFEADILALKNAGYNQADFKTVEPFAGTSSYDRWSIYKEKFNLVKPIPELVKANITVLNSLVQSASLEPIKGITEILEYAKEKDIKTAVASSSSYDFIYLMLNKLGIKQYFNVIVSGEEVKRGKPAPDIFIDTSKKLNLQVSECIVIEDSNNGVLAAKSAGMKCVAYVNKSSGNQDLSKADIITEKFTTQLFDL